MTAPTWDERDEAALAYARKMHFRSEHLTAKKQRATAYQLWKSIPWYRRLFMRAPG